MPHIKDLDNYTNVFLFHNLAQAQQLQAYITQYNPKKAVVIGGGLSGVEAADALAVHKMQVDIIEKNDQLLARHLTRRGVRVLERAMARSGVRVHTNRTVSHLDGIGDRAQEVVLSDGMQLKTDLVIITIGLKQNTQLAQQAGLSLDQHGVSVNAYMQTSHEYIYAAGDVISTIDLISGRRMASCTWPDAMQQGRYAAYAMAGEPKIYPGAHVIISSAFFGLKFYSCGLQETAGYSCIEGATEQDYSRYLLKDDRLKGFMLLNDGRQFAQLRRSLMTQQELAAPLLKQLKQLQRSN